MNIGFLAIGNELITGEVRDQNTPCFAAMLSKLGVCASHFRCCGDQDIAHHLRAMLDECDLIVTSGGLGGTHDDQTSQAIAEVAFVDLETNREAVEHLQKNWREKIDCVDTIAHLPRGANPFCHAFGVSPGYRLKVGAKEIIALAGVPQEFREVAECFLPPIIEEKIKGMQRTFAYSVHFAHANEEKMADTLQRAEEDFPGIQIGVYPKVNSVDVVCRGKASSSEAFQKLMVPVEERLFQAFPTLAYPAIKGEITEAILAELQARGETLALAESCTGGEMAARFTKLPGASQVFLASLVTYSDAAKMQFLGVKEKTLKTYGAVSEQVVKEMIEGLFATTTADFAIAVSGIAGPSGGSAEKPVGTVWGGIAHRGKQIITGMVPIVCQASRERIIEYSTTYLYGALWRYLAYNVTPFT